MPCPSTRRLLHALTLSLLAHAFILLGVVSVLPVQLAVPAAALDVVLDAPLTTASGQSPLRGVPGPATRVRPPVLKKPTVLASAPLSSPIVPTTPEVLAAAGTVGLAGSGPLPDESSERPLDGGNTNDLHQYRISLAIAARRFRHYPAQARARGWEGAAELALVIGPRQLAPAVSVVRSSGHPVLDAQATEMMIQAVRMTALPERMKGRDFRMLLSVRFSLDDNQ